MLLLEGASAHERLMLATTLAAPWVAQQSWPLNEVQVTEQLRGAWLALVLPNLSELTAQQRARLHTQVTTYRSNRTALFLGGADPLPESTGFWAIACGRIDIEGLRAFRDQLFAEAVIAYRQGAALAPLPQRPGTERKRQEAQVDEWKDQVLEHCTRVYAEAQRTRVKNYLTTARILTDALGIQPYQQERAHHMRVAAILKGNGWVQRRDSACRYYRPIFRRT
jgi:putative DNA primase/helicase